MTDRRTRLAGTVLIPAILATAVILTHCGTAPTGSTKTEMNVAAPAASPETERELAETQPVSLTAEQMLNFGVQTRPAGAGRLTITLSIPGEIVMNADRVAHVVPRVSGIVKEVRKNIGDPVRQGEVVAVLESREMADAVSSFMAARQRASLAESTLKREEQLWLKKISAEQDYLNAKGDQVEAAIELSTSEQKLHAIGFSQAQVDSLPEQSDPPSTSYEMRAPFDATIIEKHIALGEVLKDDSDAFTIADLSSVWVNLDVQQKDLPGIRRGQAVILTDGPGVPEIRAAISYIEPTVIQESRTVHARVVIPNVNGKWRPGTYVSGKVAIEERTAPVLVPNEAILLIEGKPSVFVRTDRGFAPRQVQTGQTDGLLTEILAGLQPGQIYVSAGAFTLKSEMNKPEAE